MPGDSYVAIAPCIDQTLLVGCPRSLLQAWIDVVEMADLPLRRVDWMVSCAQRGLMLEHPDWLGSPGCLWMLRRIALL